MVKMKSVPNFLVLVISFLLGLCDCGPVNEEYYFWSGLHDLKRTMVAIYADDYHPGRLLGWVRLG
jgi:hypothetical protein